MGIVLDSSVLIAAEREKRPVSQLLASLGADYAETEFLLSSITVMELEHGWHRANTPEAALKRRRYLDEVLAIFAVVLTAVIFVRRDGSGERSSSHLVAAKAARWNPSRVRWERSPRESMPR